MKGEQKYERGYAQACKDASDEIALALTRLQVNAQAAELAGQEMARVMVRLQLTLQQWAERIEAKL